MTTIERPAGIPADFQPVIDDGGVVTGWVAPHTTPPQKDREFNFSSGNLGRVKRIVARRQLKDRVAFYEQVLKVHQPLIKAMQMTQQAFQNGIQEGIRLAAKADEEERQKVQATSSEVQAEQAATEQSQATRTLEDDVSVSVRSTASGTQA